MNKEEALAYCHEHRDEYIRDSNSISDGIEQFDCLIDCLESGHIKPEQLKEYGMDYTS